MWFWLLYVVFAVLIYLKKKGISEIINNNTGYAKARKQREKRKNTECLFDERMFPDDFFNIVLEVVECYPRVSAFYISNGCIDVEIYSQSYASTWNFEIDFNDYGHITGEYWLSSENTDSNIPDTIAKRIASAVHDLVDFCPYCGRKMKKNSRYCKQCKNRMIEVTNLYDEFDEWIILDDYK